MEKRQSKETVLETDCRAEKILRKVASSQPLLSPSMPGMLGPEEGDKTVERRRKNSVSPGRTPSYSSCQNKAKGYSSPRIKVDQNSETIATEICIYSR